MKKCDFQLKVKMMHEPQFIANKFGQKATPKKMGHSESLQYTQENFRSYFKLCEIYKNLRKKVLKVH